MRKLVYETITWEVPGFNAIGKDCRYMLLDDAPAYIQRGSLKQLIIFQESTCSSCMPGIANQVHETIYCPASKENGGEEHICLELIKHWIAIGIMIQTYSPN